MPNQPSYSCEELRATFPQLITSIIGDAQKRVSSAAAPNSATDTSLVFLTRSESYETGLQSKAPVLVIGNKAVEAFVPRAGGKTLLVVADVDLAMAFIISRFFRATPYRDTSFEPLIHPLAHIHSTAQIDATAKIGPGVIIAAEVKIGAQAFIGANSVIERGVTIGAHTTIHPLVYIGHSCVIGERCEVQPHTTLGKEGFGYGHDAKGGHHRIPHQGRVVLEEDVHIGSGCTIDRGTFGDTHIGAGTKIDNLVHLAHNSKIGRGCLLTAGFAMAGSSTVGDFVVAGGRANVTGHVTIGSHVHLAGLGTVSKDVLEPGQYGGYPLQPLQSFIKTKAAIVQLPEMRKQVARLMKKVFPEE